jgi:predicted transcriptional regulator
MNPRPLTPREQHLIERYSYCQLGMTPQQFYAKWNVNQEAIAAICSRSTSTVRCWFRRGRSYRRAHTDRPASPCFDGLSAGTL